MYLRLSGVLWFVSLIGFLASLLLTYAGLKESVAIPYSSNKSALYFSFSRETFFYFFLAVGAVINVMKYVVGGVLSKKKHDPFRTWFHGLIVTLHIFFIVIISFVEVLNSGADYRFDSIGFIIYGSVGLIVLWMLGWPVYRTFYKSVDKQLI